MVINLGKHSRATDFTNPQTNMKERTAMHQTIQPELLEEHSRLVVFQTLEHLRNRWEEEDAGKSRSKFKSAIEDLPQVQMNFALKCEKEDFGFANIDQYEWIDSKMNLLNVAAYCMGSFMLGVAYCLWMTF